MDTTIPEPTAPLVPDPATGAATAADPRLAELLASVAGIVSETVGFATVAIDLYRPAWDDFEVLVVHGADSARAALLGRRRERTFLEDLLDPRYERRNAYFVPHGGIPGGDLSYVPRLEVERAPDAWQPEDALFVPVRHSQGHLLGIVWLDEPTSRKRPTDAQLEVLVALAAQAGWAIEAAQDAAAAAQHGTALEELMRVSARLGANDSTDEILAAICEATRTALGFDVVAVELADAAADRYLPVQAAGVELDAAAADLPIAVLDRVFDPTYESEGCYLLTREQALALLGVGFSGFRSTANGRGEHAWNRHWLLVPLRDAAGDRIGFIWADDPRSRLLPSRADLQALRLLADQAEAALAQAARLHALHETGEERRTLIDRSPLAIIHLGVDRRVRSWNPAARRMFGYPDELVLGHEPPWIPAGELDDFRRRFDAQFEREVSHDVYTDRNADGTLLEVETTSAPLRAPDGTPTGMIAVLADITEQERAKRELARREQELEAMLESSPIALVRLDRDGRTQWWNAAAERIFGWTAEEAVGRRPLPVPAEAGERFEEGLAEILEGGTIRGAERTLLREDGTRTEVRLSAAPVYADDGTVDGIVAALEDVTDANRVAGDLAQRNAELEALHETAVALVGELALDVTLRQIVAHAARLVGAKSSFVFLADETNRLVPVIGHGSYAAESMNARLEPGEGLSGLVWAEGRPMKVDDYSTWARHSASFGDLGIRALACAPLVEDGNVVGVLGVSHEDPAVTFDDADLKLLERFANLASVALSKARLHEAARREVEERAQAERETAQRNSELEALHETAVRLSEQRETRQLLADVVARAAGLVGTEHGWVYLVEGDELVLHVATGTFTRRNVRRFSKHAGLAGHVLETGEPFVVDDYARWPGRLDRFDGASLRAVCGVPLRAGSEVVGVLGVGYDEPESRFGETEVALLTRFGRLASLALENTRLHDAARSEIGERIQAELELSRQKAYSERLIQTANVLIVGVDGNGLMTIFNEEAERVTGYAREELVGTAGLELLVPRATHPEPWGAFAAWAAGTGAMPERFETAVVTRTGEERSVSWRCREVALDGGERGMVGFGLDVTEQRQIEQQLQHAQRLDAVGQLTGGIAHDFNNLLTAISGYGELALAEIAADAPARHCLEEMMRASGRAGNLTSQLLAFGRRQVLQPVPLDLNSVVAELEPMLSRLLDERIELILALDPDLGIATADPGQIEQVIVNLAINARDAMQNGGRLLLETRNAELDEAFAACHPGATPGAHVALSVRDEGEGMDEATLARIFEPFFTTKPVGQGTGLGLSTVYGIVKQTGGSIVASSECGRGTTFELYLPRVPARARPATPAPPPAAPSAAGTGTILLAEDDHAVRSLTERLLRDAGYTVLSAALPEEAIRLADEHDGPIDLLITDVVMPGMSGPELAERLLAGRPCLPALFTSGYARDALDRSGELPPHDAGFLAKPFTAAVLTRTVSEVIRDTRNRAA